MPRDFQMGVFANNSDERGKLTPHLLHSVCDGTIGTIKMESSPKLFSSPLLLKKIAFLIGDSV